MAVRHAMSFVRRGKSSSAAVTFGLVGTFVAIGCVPAGEDRPPLVPRNVLVILCDDLNDAIPVLGGHPRAITPNIDRLQERGVAFTNAHCNAPKCAPSRASLWSGLYPSTTGYYTANIQLEYDWRELPILEDSRTLMEHFRNNGYTVYGTGKIFHNGMADDTVLDVVGAKPSFGPFPWGGEYEPWNGCGCGDPIWCVRKGAGHPDLPPPLDLSYWEGFAPLSTVPDVNGFHGWSMACEDFFYADEQHRDLMPDEESTELVAQWLAAAQEPFLMVIGLNRPHIPRYVPREYFDLYPLEGIELPPVLDDDLLDCPGILWRDPCTGAPDVPSAGLQELLDAGGIELWKRWVQSYLASVSFVDARLGDMLDALDASDRADDTILVFSSDHGQHMGEKGRLSKGTLWEETTRVPLIISGPGIGAAPAATCDHPVSLIDLYPTLIDLMDLPPEPNDLLLGGNGYPLDGHSLVPFLNDPSTDDWAGPPVAVTALFGPYNVPNGRPSAAADQHLSVRSRCWRYTLCSDGTEELYYHGGGSECQFGPQDDDPQEWTNLAWDPQFLPVKLELRAQLCDLTGMQIPSEVLMLESWRAQPAGAGLDDLLGWSPADADGTDSRGGIRSEDPPYCQILELAPAVPGRTASVVREQCYPDNDVVEIRFATRVPEGDANALAAGLSYGKPVAGHRLCFVAHPALDGLFVAHCVDTGEAGGLARETPLEFFFYPHDDEWVRWSIVLDRSAGTSLTITVRANGSSLGAIVIPETALAGQAPGRNELRLEAHGAAKQVGPVLFGDLSLSVL